MSLFWVWPLTVWACHRLAVCARHRGNTRLALWRSGYATVDLSSQSDRQHRITSNRVLSWLSSRIWKAPLRLLWSRWRRTEVSQFEIWAQFLRASAAEKAITNPKKANCGTIPLSSTELSLQCIPTICRRHHHRGQSYFGTYPLWSCWGCRMCVKFGIASSLLLLTRWPIFVRHYSLIYNRTPYLWLMRRQEARRTAKTWCKKSRQHAVRRFKSESRGCHSLQSSWSLS